jgi:O-antigen/teichoic acid export membrane protein
MTISRGEVGRSAVWSIFEGGLAQLLTLGVFLVTAHFIPPSAFGLLATAMLLIDFFRQVVIEGIVTSVTTQEKPTDAEFNACFFLVAGASALVAIALFSFAPVIARLAGIPGLEDVLRPISALALTLGLSRTHEAFLSRNLKFRALAIRSLASILIGGTVGIVMAVSGFGLWSLIAQQLTTAVISLITLWTACSWRPRLNTNREALRHIFRYARHVSATGVTNFANNQADIAFTAYYLGPTNTGYYNSAKRIGLAMNQIIATSLNRVAMPTMARLKGDAERAGRVLVQAVGLTSTITAPLFAGIASLAPDAIHIAMGDKWEGAATILSIISLSYFLSTVGQYNQSMLLVKGKPHWQTLLTAIYAVVNISLFFVFVRYGVVALALAFTGRALLFSPVSIGLALKVSGVTWKAYLGGMLPPVIAAGIMGLSVALARHELLWLPPIARVCLLVPAGALLYFGLLFVINRRSVTELITVARHTLVKV